MSNQTKCPYCETLYVVSEFQLNKTKGKFRCGNCGKKFVARIIKDNESQKNDGVKPQEWSINTNDTQASINEITKTVDLSDLDVHQAPTQASSTDPVDREGIDESEESEENATPTNNDLFTTDNTSSDQALSEYNQPPEDIESSQEEHTPSDSGLISNSLINEVDQLIEEKILTEPTVEPQKRLEQDSTEDEKPFSLTPSLKERFKTGFATLFLLLIGLLLLLALGYQLWLRQAITLPDNELLNKAAPYIETLKGELYSSLEVTLPERRDLKNLQLLSAQAETHPTRPSMILMRLSLISRAKITQPLPWIELSLTDEDGRLVSRRALSPNDYLYNNNTESTIRSNELKKVTVELLSFPKQAHGYEIRLLSK